MRLLSELGEFGLLFWCEVLQDGQTVFTSAETKPKTTLNKVFDYLKLENYKKNLSGYEFFGLTRPEVIQQLHFSLIILNFILATIRYLPCRVKLFIMNLLLIMAKIVIKVYLFYQLNITSLLNHIDELRVLLADKPNDVLSINETRLDDLVEDSDVYISGYEIVRRDRSINGRFGGGVCFYIRTNINYSLRSDLSIDQLENLSAEIRKPNSKPFLISTWYRPPNSTVEIFTYFEALVGKLDSENLEYYIMGDMNCNLAPDQLDNNANILSSMADIYGMDQLIIDPTRCSYCFIFYPN